MIEQFTNGFQYEIEHHQPRSRIRARGKFGQLLKRQLTFRKLVKINGVVQNYEKHPLYLTKLEKLYVYFKLWLTKNTRAKISKAWFIHASHPHCHKTSSLPILHKFYDHCGP